MTKYKVKILIVDDNPKNLFALETTFKDIEAEFVKATSGNDALSLSQKKRSKITEQASRRKDKKLSA